MHFTSAVVSLLLIIYTERAMPTVLRGSPAASSLFRQRLGAKDVFGLVPGVTPEQVCSTCVRILEAAKQQLGSDNARDTADLMQFVQVRRSNIDIA